MSTHVFKKAKGKLVILSAVVFLLKMGFKRLQHVLSVLTVLYGQYVKYYKRLSLVGCGHS